LKEALNHYTLNLELSRASGYKQGEEVSLLNLGTTCELLDELDKAIEWHTLHLSSVVERGDLHEEARALRTLAGIYKETQQMTKAEDYYRKLAAVCGRLGNREEQEKANLLVHQMKVDVKQEKLLSAKQSQKTFRRYKSSPRRTKTRTVSNFSIYQLPTPRRRSLATLTADSVQDNWGSSDGLDHPGTEGMQFQERLIATPPLQHRTHRERSVQEMPFSVQGGRAHSYKLSNVTASDDRPLPLPPTPSDTASLTSYESVGGRQGQRYHCKTNFAGNRHHRKELQHMGTDLSQPVSELEGRDKEWEQWLHIQDTT
jgi:hypothetical protein